MNKSSYTFDSQIESVGYFEHHWNDEYIKNEPMFYNASVDFAREYGGPITRMFLAGVSTSAIEFMNNSVIDTRVHMLMPGWYPAIPGPGYHHDDVPRPYNGPPEYDSPAYLSEHITGLVNAHIATTEFAIGECTLPRVPSDRVIYSAWHHEIEKRLRACEMNRVHIESGQLVKFNWQSFHTATRATSKGWRWFGRISRNTDRVKNRTNEIRRQVQVYMDDPTQGW